MADRHPSDSPDVVAPRFDQEREERLRWLRVELNIGKPTPKQFDLDEMLLLRDDMDAMLNEIGTLRASLAQLQEERERLVKEFELVRQQIAAVCVLNGTPGDGDIVSAVKHLAAERSRALATLNEERERLDWLSRMVVNVRESTPYGSLDKFWSSPPDDDEADRPSDLRAQIDAHITKTNEAPNADD